jgi:hypothetical protein
MLTLSALICSYLHRATPHRTAPHRTAPHRTAPHRTAPHRAQGENNAYGDMGNSATGEGYGCEFPAMINR